MSPWLLYFILKMDSFVGIFKGLMVCSIFVTVLLGIMALAFLDVGEEFANKFIRWWKVTIPTAVVCAIIMTALPSTKETAAIYLLPKAINNEQIQNVSGNTLKILEKYTENVLESLGEKMIDKVADKVEEKIEKALDKGESK